MTVSAPNNAHSPINSKPLPNHIDEPLVTSKRPAPDRLKLTYDIVMIVAITIDLVLISLDAILMSEFSVHAAQWLATSHWLLWYQSTLHEPLRTAGGVFTVFLIIELLLRWAVAIKQQVYYRWFFFSFCALV